MGSGVVVGHGGGAYRSSRDPYGRPCRHAACIRWSSSCGRLGQAPALSGGKRRAGHNRKLGAAAVSAPRRSAAPRPALGRLICNTDYPKLRPVYGLLLVASGVGPPAPGRAAPALGRHALRSVGELVASLAPPSPPRPGLPAWLWRGRHAACHARMKHAPRRTRRRLTARRKPAGFAERGAA